MLGKVTDLFAFVSVFEFARKSCVFAKNCRYIFHLEDTFEFIRIYDHMYMIITRKLLGFIIYLLTALVLEISINW
jgi:hypothetical protein